MYGLNVLRARKHETLDKADERAKNLHAAGM
jgi:hypothetical protein